MTHRRTVWRITALPYLPQVKLELSVDSDAAPVVDAIEDAADRAGIVLERVEPDLALTDEGHGAR